MEQTARKPRKRPENPQHEYQQSRVYSWEETFISPKDSTTVPFENVEPLVHYIWETLGYQFPPAVRPLSKKATISGNGCRTEVRFQPETKTWLILHELAHALTWESDASVIISPHGKEFCGCYAYLLEKFLGIPQFLTWNSLTQAGIEYTVFTKPYFMD
jgi:hypothetical protein